MHAHLDGEVLKHADLAAKILGDKQIIVTPEDNKRILRKTDQIILVILVWVYFLQILDKSVLGYSAVFGLQTDTHLVGTQYSLVGSVGYFGQIGILPFLTYIMVRVRPRELMPLLVFCWGASLTGMAGAHDYGGLLATRFLLGLFEAGCLPLFQLIIMSWYRRAEQPLRIAAYYGTNGASTIIGSALAFGLGHIKSPVLHSYQIIFLFFGLLTVISSFPIRWKLDNSIGEARFLSEEDRLKGIERLRANQQGTGTTEFKWRQAVECLLEPKTYLFFAMTFLLNVAAAVTNTFGPLIISGLGYDPYISSLLNMPFGAVQLIVIFSSVWAAYNLKNKSYILMGICIPVIVGTGMLYGLGRSSNLNGALLFAYYLLAFTFGGNPLILAWMAANTAGHTKKSTVMICYQIASSVGNVVGPLMFNSADKPYYKNGLKGTMACFCVLLGIYVLQVINLMFLNKRKEAQRVANGKPAKLRDLSMMKHFEQANDQTLAGAEAGAHAHLGDQAFLDLTDQQNDEFVYVL
ncbi:MFS general substrate transporter [Calocera cornea HHB12733]|uniref:MFS general substrate transporter n=1 Tax=Calocera cornea HHB12733 TaxID=1353952 RepID=A0A165CIU8_9BASI|nr:MFS general substrate transporter [Calocera cornea HHB12733]